MELINENIAHLIYGAAHDTLTSEEVSCAKTYIRHNMSFTLLPKILFPGRIPQPLPKLEWTNLDAYFMDKQKGFNYYYAISKAPLFEEVFGARDMVAEMTNLVDEDLPEEDFPTSLVEITKEQWRREAEDSFLRTLKENSTGKMLFEDAYDMNAFCGMVDAGMDVSDYDLTQSLTDTRRSFILHYETAQGYLDMHK
jgi:hypothetical protein